MELTNNAKRMLKAMRADPERTWDLDAILEATDWSDQAHVAGAGGGLGEAGMVVVSEQRTTLWSLGPEGEAAAESGLLEARVWDWLSAQDEGSRGMRNLQASEAASKQEAGIAVGLLKDVGVPLVNGSFSVPGNTAAIDATIEMRTEFISSLAEAGSISEADLDGGLLEHFHGRKGLLDSEERVERTWRLTARGIAIDDEDLEEILHVAEITPDLLQGEEWRTADFKPYDVDLPAPTPVGGRAHPMQALIERIRAIFLEMGFSEIEGDFVQSAGWNMDALFIPQDHPAREMQDTFYLDEPASIDLAAERVAQWADVHQSGGGTGSTGWGSEFSEETAHKGLLRTHTTVNTIRYLADRPNEPCRVFGIGRVFRKESIDRTHLPEFHQIEGIIMEPEASLPMLVTTLKTFYEKMGYPEVRVRPAYFPYTEPSMEVEVKWRGEWLELGGSGIFRPEVTEPLGCKWPVCAWGMGLERLAMLVLGLDDIRQLYLSDLDWLSRQPIL